MKLYAVGVGPGSPDLLTVRAAEILRRVPIVFSPLSAMGTASRALEVVGPYLDASRQQIVELSFPMEKEQDELEEDWEEAAGQIAEYLAPDKEGAYIAIGDISLYATFAYVQRLLARDYPQIQIEILPGIPSFSGVAALLGTPYATADDRIAILPATFGRDNLRQVFRDFETIILMKVNRVLEEVIDALEAEGLADQAVFVTKCGMPDQEVVTDIRSLRFAPRPSYFSIIMVGKNVEFGGMWRPASATARTPGQPKALPATPPVVATTGIGQVPSTDLRATAEAAIEVIRVGRCTSARRIERLEPAEAIGNPIAAPPPVIPLPVTGGVKAAPTGPTSALAPSAAPVPAAPHSNAAVVPSEPGGKLFLVGFGPGNHEHLTFRAREAIAEAEVIIGYRTYVRLVKDLTQGKEVHYTGMTEELERARKAVSFAYQGRKVALISSGDIGIYGMAGPAIEILKERGWRPGCGVAFEVIPGVTALSSCGSVLGAPVMHDFVAISLSNLLTPWELIVRRIEAAGQGDFIIALYNPKSGRRTQQIVESQRILLKYKRPDTPVGIVKSGHRKGQRVVITTLADMLNHEIGMLTTIIIGNAATFVWENMMITPRGYQSKYLLESLDLQAAAALAEQLAGAEVGIDPDMGLKGKARA
ncbi:MAG: precorrin-3B C(17)-methyltransferase [candidate division NC10 bacterium]|nr:precorrin-3B C(17)-methyltransferase [candidate division NC10 bacterium]